MSQDETLEQGFNMIFQSTQAVDVGIPVHNGEKYLKRTLDCLLNQSYPISRIIILNDGSADGSAEIIAEFCKLEIVPQITVLSNKVAQGVGRAYNKLIEHADAEYLLILDQDDFIFPTYIEKLLSVEVGRNVMRAGIWTSNSLAIRVSSLPLRILGLSFRVPPKVPVLGIFTTRAAVLYPTEVLKTIRFSNSYYPGSDIEHLHAVRERIPFYLVPKARIHYEIHSASTTSKNEVWTPPSEMGVLYKIDSKLRSVLRKVVR